MPELPAGAPLLSHLFAVLRSPEQHATGADGLRYVTDEDTLHRVVRGLRYDCLVPPCTSPPLCVASAS